MTHRHWCGRVKDADDFGKPIVDEFVDGKTCLFGQPWAIMSPESFELHGKGIGTGLGQRYRKQSDGRWLKIEG